MWQQLDCDAAPLTRAMAGVAVQISFHGSKRRLAPVRTERRRLPLHRHIDWRGFDGDGFYNVQQGDAPYMKVLADTYTLSDNYHQAVNGGTGANHIMLGTADAIYFSDERATPRAAPQPVNRNAPGTPVVGHKSALSEVENPNHSQHQYYYSRTAMAAATDLLQRLPPAPITAADPMSIAPTPRNRRPGRGDLPPLAQEQGRHTLRSRALLLVNNYNPGYLETAATPIRTPTPIIMCSRSRRRPCAPSATR